MDKRKLWDEYTKDKSAATREKIILEYAPLVKIVAGRLSMYLGSHVEYEDLVSYGIFGLIDAIEKFDSTKDVKFETYASLRIRGSILDQIRKMDWIPRTLRQKQKKIDTAIKEIELQTGKTATDHAVAEQMGISEDELTEWQSQMKVTNVISLNEYLEQGSEISGNYLNEPKFEMPEEVIERSELKKILMDAITLLTERERRVIELYYYEELTLKEISRILEVTESRVSQLHTKGLQKMKKKLGNYQGVLSDN